MTDSEPDSGVSRAEIALLTGLGLLLLLYGVVQWTDMFMYTPPAFVYIIAGLASLLWGISLTRRS